MYLYIYIQVHMKLMWSTQFCRNNYKNQSNSRVFQTLYVAKQRNLKLKSFINRLYNPHEYICHGISIGVVNVKLKYIYYGTN